MSPPPGYQPFGDPGVVKNHPKAITSFVLSLVAPLFLVLGIPAVVLGAQAKREIAQNPGVYKNTWMAQAGFIIGIVDLALWAIVVIQARR